MSILIYYFKN